MITKVVVKANNLGHSNMVGTVSLAGRSDLSAQSYFINYKELLAKRMNLSPRKRNEQESEASDFENKVFG